MTFLFLSSKDFSNVYQNDWFDFTVNLPKGLEFEKEEDWECALMDISCVPLTEREFVVYTDVIKQSYIKNTSAPVLRIVHNSQSVFDKPYYFLINGRCISVLRIYIRDLETNYTPTESVSELTCTLRFRKKRRQELWKVMLGENIL